jgi:hypothetical protein
LNLWYDKVVRHGHGVTETNEEIKIHEKTWVDSIVEEITAHRKRREDRVDRMDENSAEL